MWVSSKIHTPSTTLGAWKGDATELVFTKRTETCRIIPQEATKDEKQSLKAVSAWVSSKNGSELWDAEDEIIKLLGDGVGGHFLKLTVIVTK